METVVITDAERVAGLAWVAKAASTDKARTFLSYVHVEGGKAVSTDGHRLHIFEPETLGIADGEYTVISKTKKQVILGKIENPEKYPAWEKIEEKAKSGDVIASGYVGEKNNGQSLFLCKTIKAMSSVAVDIALLSDAVIPGMDWEVLQGENPLGPIYLKNCTHSAVIMPLRD